MVYYSSSPLAEITEGTLKKVTYASGENTFNLNWWEKNENKNFYRHDALLFNFFHHKKLNRESMKVPSDVNLIFDSGGFEVLSRRAKGLPCNINPLEVLRWEEESANIGLTLDLSPVNLQPTGEGGKSVATNPKPITHEEFTKRLEETCKNNDVFQDNRGQSKYNLKIYNVVHSGMGKIDSIDEWYERVKDFKFEGWALAPKPSFDVVKIAVDTMFLYDRGVRENLHVLGISGFKVFPILAYIEKYIKNISTDSFSYGVNTVVRKMMSPYMDIFYKPSEHSYNKVPCLCPVCSNLNSVEDLYRTDVVGYSLIGLHNHWTYINYVKYIEALVDNKEEYARFSRKYPNLEKALNFIDYSIEHGWEEAISNSGLNQNNLEQW
jgi:hypothetical protein